MAMIVANTHATPQQVDAETVTRLFKHHGAVLLRGFATDLDGFRAFTGQYCSTSVFNESPDRQLLDTQNNIQSVNGGEMAFPLHPELSREPWKPDACFFCCLRAPLSGGQTTICDGIEIVRAMPAAMRSALAERRLRYTQPAPPEVLEYWLGTASPTDAELAAPPAPCPYEFRRTPGGIVRSFSRPALHQPLFSDEPAFGNFLLFARFLLGRTDFPVFSDGTRVPELWLQEIKRISDALTTPIDWQSGDLLMLDNSRFMHGRTAIDDPHERLIASYFGYLRFAPPITEEPEDAPWRRAQFRPPVPGPAQSVRAT